MNRPLIVELRIERDSPPPPKKRTAVVYPFGEIPVGCSAVFPRAANTIRNRLSQYQKERRRNPRLPVQRFKAAQIAARQTRVWRIE